jgi:hypothetical protein
VEMVMFIVYTKLSATEIQCNACPETSKPKIIKTPYRGTAILIQHLQKYPDYQKKYDELKNKKKS